MDLRNAYMYPLLRQQGEITHQKFIQYLRTNPSNQGNFLIAISDNIQSFETLSYFKDIIAWYNYVRLKFEGKISYEDSL